MEELRWFRRRLGGFGAPTKVSCGEVIPVVFRDGGGQVEADAMRVGLMVEMHPRVPLSASLTCGSSQRFTGLVFGPPAHVMVSFLVFCLWASVIRLCIWAFGCVWARPNLFIKNQPVGKKNKKRVPLQNLFFFIYGVYTTLSGNFLSLYYPFSVFMVTNMIIFNILLNS